MRYAGFMPNDFVNGLGVSVSYWAQGCPHQCPGCHNPETWDFNGGKELPPDIIDKIKKAITANGIQRNFSVLGGEPLCDENIESVEKIISAVRAEFPKITICLWSGYTYSELKERAVTNKSLASILNNINILVDGRYEQAQRDVTLAFRGSTNQNIYIINTLFEKI